MFCILRSALCYPISHSLWSMDYGLWTTPEYHPEPELEPGPGPDQQFNLPWLCLPQAQQHTHAGTYRHIQAHAGTRRHRCSLCYIHTVGILYPQSSLVALCQVVVSLCYALHGVGCEMKCSWGGGGCVICWVICTIPRLAVCYVYELILHPPEHEYHRTTGL